MSRSFPYNYQILCIEELHLHQKPGVAQENIQVLNTVQQTSKKTLVPTHISAQTEAGFEGINLDTHHLVPFLKTITIGAQKCYIRGI